MAVREHDTVREGIYGGVLSGAAIALWLFIVDSIGGHPFFTPDVLGSGLLRFLGAPRMSDTMALHVAAYTVFHFAAFAIIGIILIWVAHQARRTPAILAGFLVFFVAAELGFYGLAAMLSADTVLGAIAWYQIMVANLLAAAVLFAFVWMRHPELKGQFTNALEGTDD
ncbi:MAG: hypothetical protein M3R65_01530 [Gemmatimonadota bacterium]|nr:hypothetical protein [Gemmatimonadota bacterium]